MAVKVKTKSRLDPLNFAYGLGAAVVITGVLLRFMDSEYGGPMLIVGLVTEALVFAISAFEMKKDSIEYKWDRLFPQLTTDGETKIQQIEEMLERSNLDPMIIERLANSIERLEQNVAKMNNVSDTASLSDNLARMKQTSENFEREITKLNANVAELNNRYASMLEAMGQKH